MILGIYADLHANMPALDAMQAVAGHVDQWVALGDSVGLYPQVNEVLDWQRQHGVMYVQGDHEAALFGGGGLSGSFTGTESIKKQAQVISIENLNVLSELPSVCNFESDGLRMCATHFLSSESHIADSKYAIDLSLLEKKYEGYDFVFFGHTHLPTVLYGRSTIFINPGSAGFPVDVERRCSMVALDTERRCFDFIRFDYDTDRLIRVVENSGYNQKLVAYIRNGHRWI
jgi:predicted phosphodiesterase